MAMEIRILFIVGTIFSVFLPLALAEPGNATFYTPHTRAASDCPGLKQGPMVAAASDAVWNKGKTVAKHSRGSVDVTIVDRCPSPCQSTFQLSKPAFYKIVDPELQLIAIDYKP
ncbi:hypothetical protein CDL15_Pgr013082 [Punica granatum]|uniref:RlpA-like protein double-psi beta-barrel domain-containing protein n=1 Tax=Punica granatum TaxID=22663 RepID=A0A218WIF0_PUNGR|nr:hypothetical protein CDL15_Pgr013082 [Punica granatum]